MSIAVSSVFGQKYEAENAMLSGTVVENALAGYSGSGYVTGFDMSGDKVVFEIDISEAGLYELIIGYAAPNGEKTNDIYVNDEFAGYHLTPASNSFTSNIFGKLYLQAGVNTILFGHNWGYIHLDYLELAPAIPNEIHSYPESLVNYNATEKTKLLYQYLREIYGHRIISGQQTDAGGTEETDFLGEQTGRHPAIKGFDLMDYSPSRVENGTTSVHTQKAREWWESGGIVSMMWHWNAPKDLTDSEQEPWWRGFYTSATTFDVGIAMNDESSEEYSLLLRDIDAIAAELNELSSAGVPLLWRPLHEAEGGWFWWGAKGPEACVWLWRLMYDRLTNVHELNNLIWIWTGTDSEDALEWFPGDDVVDIVGADIYLSNRNYSPSFALFDNLAGIHQGRNIIAMTETGTIPDPDHLEEQKAKWAWFMVWARDFLFDNNINEKSHLNYVYNHEYVITKDELPDFDNYVSPEFPVETITSISPDADEFLIYPNPVSSILTIDRSSSAGALKATVTNLYGQVVLRQEIISANQIRMDFSELPSGIYILFLQNSNTTMTKRIIKY